MGNEDNVKSLIERETHRQRLLFSLPTFLLSQAVSTVFEQKLVVAALLSSYYQD